MITTREQLVDRIDGGLTKIFESISPTADLDAMEFDCILQAWESYLRTVRDEFPKEHVSFKSMMLDEDLFKI